MKSVLIKSFICLTPLFLIVGCGSEEGTKESNGEISGISECESYGEAGCELSFEDVNLGNNKVSLRYEFVINESEQETIRVYVDEIPTREITVYGELKLIALGVIDDVVILALESDGYADSKIVKFEIFDRDGHSIIDNDGLINDVTIIDLKINKNDITIMASDMKSETEYTGSDICDPRFKELSIYSESLIANATYKLNYNGNQEFSEPEVVTSATVEEVINNNCK